MLNRLIANLPVLTPDKVLVITEKQLKEDFLVYDLVKVNVGLVV